MSIEVDLRSWRRAQILKFYPKFMLPCVARVCIEKSYNLTWVFDIKKSSLHRGGIVIGTISHFQCKKMTIEEESSLHRAVPFFKKNIKLNKGSSFHTQIFFRALKISVYQVPYWTWEKSRKNGLGTFFDGM